MTLAGVCVALTVLVAPAAHVPTTEHETHEYLFCTPGVYLDTREIRPGADGHTDCSEVAHEYIYKLQLAGILPGAPERIAFKYGCRNAT